MKKISTMTWVKLSLTAVVVGTIVFFFCHWHVSLEPPQKVAPAKPQILVDVVMPAYIIAEQNDVAYVKSNNELYNVSITLVCENAVNVGDTVQLSYCSYFNYRPVSRWDLIAVSPPFYEYIDQTESQHVEYIKGVVRVVAM